MKHLSMQNCIDYVREVVDPKQASDMAGHLSSGCARCQREIMTWRRFMSFAQAEMRYQALEPSVRPVKANFAALKLGLPRGEHVEVASLVFDSAQQAGASGVRSGSVATRHLLYRAGSVCIDMQIQPKLGSEAMVLFGQIMDSTPPVRGMGNIPVSLLSGASTLTKLHTNSVGEFNFGLEAPNHLQLVFGIPDHRTLVVPVPNVQIDDLQTMS